MTHPLENSKTFAEENYSMTKWRDLGYVEFYRMPSQRFCVHVQQVDDLQMACRDLDRHNDLANAGISSEDVDAEQLATAIVDELFNFLSIHDMEHIKRKLDKHLEEWENGHQRRMEMVGERLGAT